MSQVEKKTDEALDSIAHALNCDLDCSWRVLEAVKDLLEVGMSIDQILFEAERCP